MTELWQRLHGGAGRGRLAVARSGWAGPLAGCAILVVTGTWG